MIIEAILNDKQQLNKIFCFDTKNCNYAINLSWHFNKITREIVH
jgi:hypothetical protein